MAKKEFEMVLQKLSRIEKTVENLDTLTRNIERLMLDTESVIRSKKKK